LLTTYHLLVFVLSVKKVAEVEP